MAMLSDVIEKLLIFFRRPEAFPKLLLVATRMPPHVQIAMLAEALYQLQILTGEFRGFDTVVFFGSEVWWNFRRERQTEKKRRR